jgi:hypothetical protein
MSHDSRMLTIGVWTSVFHFQWPYCNQVLNRWPTIWIRRPDRERNVVSPSWQSGVSGLPEFFWAPVMVSYAPAVAQRRPPLLLGIWIFRSAQVRGAVLDIPPHKASVYTNGEPWKRVQVSSVLSCPDSKANASTDQFPSFPSFPSSASRGCLRDSQEYRYKVLFELMTTTLIKFSKNALYILGYFQLHHLPGDLLKPPIRVHHC